jgi:hypothetical protein
LAEIYLFSLRDLMTPEQLAKLKRDATLRKRLAKLMARDCFRNIARLEDFHGGKFPTTQTGDYSDVKVLTPDREIQWSELSRISDEEMKALMIDIVNHCYAFLTGLCTPEAANIIEKLKENDEVPEWNDPVLLIPPHL